MERFLLFDSGCGFCTQIANSIEQEANGLLKIRSLHDSEIQAILNQLSPNWNWEPMLLEIKDSVENVRVFKGFAMKIRLTKYLGFSSAWRIMKLLNKDLAVVGNNQTSRRNLLKGAGILLASLALTNTRPSISKAEQLLKKDRFSSFIKLAKENDTFQKFLREFQLNSKLRLDESKTYAIPYQNYIGVYFPISGGAGYSFYAIWFDSLTKQPVFTAKYLYTYHQNRNIKALFEFNDKIILNAILTPEGDFIKGEAYDANGQKVDLAGKNFVTKNGKTFWECFEDCLDELTVPTWVISAVGAVCAVACVLTQGLGCSVCAIGVVSAFSAEFGACAGCCISCRDCNCPWI